jgi:hypothetical protein
MTSAIPSPRAAARPIVPFLRLSAALLLSFHGARAQSSACSDAFDGPGLGAAWTFLDADNKPGGSAAIKDSALVLAGKGHDIFNATNEFVAVRRSDLSGDFDVSVKIESQTNTFDWAQAGILAANDVSALNKGGYAVVDVTPSQGFHLFSDAAGTMGTLDAHTDVGKSAYPVWIRLTRTGTKFAAYYKTSAAAAWTAIGQSVTPQGTTANTPSQIALFSLSHNDTAEAKTVFDDFACQGATTGISAPAGRPAGGYLGSYGRGAWAWEWGREPRRADGRALRTAPSP